jgi:hypothetical protein
VIVSDKLIIVLEKHCSVPRYSAQDLRGINPTLCPYCTPTNPTSSPSWEPQWRLNNVMRQVIKKDVMKLLHVEIIYPMPFSEWVSPIQIVSKKAGRTVVENSKN